MNTPLINATLRVDAMKEEIEQLDEVKKPTHLVNVSWTHRKYQKEPFSMSYRVHAQSNDDAIQKVTKYLRKTYERVVRKASAVPYTGQPAAATTIGEAAAPSITPRVDRMNTPLINATLRYLDEQMLDEAKKSPWTVKKHQGDDEYSYALFKDGKPAMTGLGKREAKYHLEKAKAGHYDRKLDEEVEQIDETKMRAAKNVPHNEIHVKDVSGLGRYTALKVHAVGARWKKHIKPGTILDDDWYGDLESDGAIIKEVD